MPSVPAAAANASSNGMGLSDCTGNTITVTGQQQVVERSTMAKEISVVSIELPQGCGGGSTNYSAHSVPKERACGALKLGGPNGGASAHAVVEARGSGLTAMESMKGRNDQFLPAASFWTRIPQRVVGENYPALLIK